MVSQLGYYLMQLTLLPVVYLLGIYTCININDNEHNYKVQNKMIIKKNYVRSS